MLWCELQDQSKKTSDNARSRGTSSKHFTRLGSTAIFQALVHGDLLPRARTHLNALVSTSYLYTLQISTNFIFEHDSWRKQYYEIVGNLTGKYSVVTKNLLFPSFSVVCSTAKGLFPLSRNFSMRTHVDFTRANKIEAMYEWPQVNVKVEPRSTFTLNLRVAFHTLPLFYLHP